MSCCCACDLLGGRPHSLTHSFSSMFNMRNRARHFISWFHLLTCLEKIAASHYLACGRLQWLSMPCLILSIRLYVSRVSKFDIFSWRETGTFRNFLQLSTLCSLLSLHSVEFSAKPSAFWTWIRSHSCFCSKRQMTRKFHEFWHGIGETGETGFSNSQATAKPEWYHSIWVDEPSELEWDVTPRRCSKAIHGITRKVPSEIAFQKMRYKYKCKMDWLYLHAMMPQKACCSRTGAFPLALIKSN